jgi:hypothetical protein
MLRAGYFLKTRMVCLMVSLGALGCGSAQTSPPPPTSLMQLRLIGVAYARATDELDHPPQSKQEIMPFLKDLAKGFDNPADLLRSTVDGEEFVIHYGVDFRDVIGKDVDLPVLAYEKTGQDGKRAVLLHRFTYLKTDEELANLKFPPGYKAPF